MAHTRKGKHAKQFRKIRAEQRELENLEREVAEAKVFKDHCWVPIAPLAGMMRLICIKCDYKWRCDEFKPRHSCEGDITNA